MDLVGPAGLVIREKWGTTKAAGTVRCPRCGGQNPAGGARCRSCSAALPASPPATPRAANEGAAEIDEAFNELEELTQDEAPPAMQFQCPACDRFVEETAARCRCGAVFEPPPDVLGYECPRCGARVAPSATQCRCGARFSD